MGGSPCQGFSFAGKQLNFKDEKSKLFFEYVRILEEVKPKYFLLENVKMKQQYQDIISGYLGVQPIEINSALVSAQTRKRLYWTNIPNIIQPQDKGILFKDVMLKGNQIPPNLIHSERAINYMDRPLKNGGSHWDYGYIQDIRNDKAKCLVANLYKGVPYNVLKDSDCIRKMHPNECEILQTLPIDYTAGVSNTQRYKCIGNAWTPDVIVHIIKGLKKNYGK